ncbi:hypothetical protein [Neobacillus vireti]|uniref:hypothetical protein n=1 Tax=Neobacillus vireti TaxID=220686 RepID=UPI002FFD7F4E
MAVSKKRPEPTRKNTPAMIASTLAILISFVFESAGPVVKGKVTGTVTDVGAGSVLDGLGC